jgi:hypothetical protein
MNLANDKKLISLDFLSECGSMLMITGTAICAVASAERVDILEVAIRQARSILIEAIAEFKNINGARDEH